MLGGKGATVMNMHVVHSGRTKHIVDKLISCFYNVLANLTKSTYFLALFHHSISKIVILAISFVLFVFVDYPLVR